VPVNLFLRALAAVNDGLPRFTSQDGSDEELLQIFGDIDNNPDRLYIPSTLYQEPEWDLSSGVTVGRGCSAGIFQAYAPGDPASFG